MGLEQYLFEIPIYRIYSEQFSETFDSDLEKHFNLLWPGRGRDEASNNLQQSVEESFWKNYGMPWRYNQTVGWLRIYRLGSQIRGELWFTNAKKLVRRPIHRTVFNKGKAFELHTTSRDNSDQIRISLRKEILESVRRLRGSKLVVDLECFDNASVLINWHSLIYDTPDA